MKKLLKGFFFGWAINALAIYIAAAYISIEGFDFDYGNWKNLVLVSLGFSIVAMLMRPFAKLLALPFRVVGIIFFLLADAAALYIVSLFVKDFTTGDLKSTFIAGAVIGVINFVLHLIIK